MSKMRILSGKTFTVDLGNDENVERHILVRLNARMRKAILKNKFSRFKFLQWLRAEGVIEQGGCQCSHCMNGWDCCGRWYLSHSKVKPAPKGVFIVKIYSRNI